MKIITFKLLFVCVLPRCCNVFMSYVNYLNKITLNCLITKTQDLTYLKNVV